MTNADGWSTFGGVIDAEGHFVTDQGSDDDVVLSRITPGGEHLRAKQYPLFTTEGPCRNNSIVATDDGGIMIAGFTMGPGTNSRDGFVMKFDPEGTILSQQRTHAGDASNAFHRLHKGTNGYFATGCDMLLSGIADAT